MDSNLKELAIAIERQANSTNDPYGFILAKLAELDVAETKTHMAVRNIDLNKAVRAAEITSDSILDFIALRDRCKSCIAWCKRNHDSDFVRFLDNWWFESPQLFEAACKRSMLEYPKAEVEALMQPKVLPMVGYDPDAAQLPKIHMSI